MTAFRVWAPRATRVDLALGEGRHPMTRAGGGWWVGEGIDAPGGDYAFAVDGGEPLPDPRSPWQPRGVTFERSRLDWSEPARAPHADLLDWHAKLLRFRRETPALTDGRLDRVQVRHDAAAGWLVVERGPVLVACNMGKRTQRLATDGEAEMRLASDPGAAPAAVPRPRRAAWHSRRTRSRFSCARRTAERGGPRCRAARARPAEGSR